MHSIVLQSSDATITDGDILGRLGFAASSETGAEAIKVAGKIEAIAEEAFDASNNATEMVFSLASDGDAATKMTLSSTGLLTVVDDVVIKSGGTIGGANDTDLLTLGNGILTVAGEISVTTLDIGGTNITATATELNYVDGVTSAIQTQLDGKAASSHNHNASDINAGTLAHERGGIEADISAISTGGILAGTSAGAMGIVSAASASDGDVLTIQADGTAAWEAASGGGGSPGGNDTEIQFNDGGSFAGDSSFIWDGTNNRLGIGTSSPDADLHIAAAAGAAVLRIENTDTAISPDELYGTIEFEGQDGSGGGSAAGVRAKIAVVGDDSGTTLGNKGAAAIIMETATDEATDTTEWFRLTGRGKLGLNANASANGEFDDASRLYVYESANATVCTLEAKQSGQPGDLLVMRSLNSVVSIFDEQGYLHIGGSDPSYPFHVSVPTATPFYVDAGSRSGNSTFEFHAGTGQTSNNATLKIISRNAANSYIYLGDNDSESIGYIRYKQSDNSMRFRTNGAEALLIESDKTVDFKISAVADSGSDYNYDSKVLPIKVGGTQYYLQLYVAAGGGGGGMP